MKVKSIAAFILVLAFTATMCLSFSLSAEEDISVPVTYDPVSILNANAGNYGIGGSNFNTGNSGTITFDNVFSVEAKGSALLSPPSAVLNEVAVLDVEWNNHLQFRASSSAPRANLQIFEYEKGKPETRALWWICGETWNYQSPKLIFTAPVSGKYDINAKSGFDKVQMTPSAIRDCVDSYKDSKVTFEIVKGETVLDSVSVSVNDPQKDFPSVTGVELIAGETIEFCVSVSVEFADNCWYGTAIEAVPVITLTEVSNENFAPTLSVNKTNFVTLKDQPVTIELTVFDPNGDEITITNSVEAAHGEVVIDLAAGKITYTPDEGFLGDDTFTLVASDGELNSNAVTINVKVCKSISVAVEEIKANLQFFYDQPQGMDWLDIDQTICNWQWQVYYDGLLGTNSQGWRVAEMAQWNQWGIALAHTDAPSMHITENDLLLLNCDKPFGLNAKGALTFVAPEDGLYLLTHTDLLSTIGLDEWRVNNPETFPASDHYTTPVYVSITKDNKIVWPTNGQPMKLDPSSIDNIAVDFPDIVTAMKKGDTLRIVVEMDKNCNSWMNRIMCDPVVYSIGEYDAAKDLNISDKDDNNDDDKDDNETPDDGNPNDPGNNNDDSGNNDQKNPDTGGDFPVSAAVLGAIAFAASVTFKRRDQSQ